MLAKASHHWNEQLHDAFRAAGYGDVRPAYGSILIPLFEEDGLRMGELARRARLSKQAMTTMIRLMERRGLVTRRADREDARAWRIFLTARARAFRPVAHRAVARLDTRARRDVGPARSRALVEALRRLLSQPS